MTPNDCLIALSKGKKDAFDSLYEQTHATVFNVCLGVLKDYHRAEDAAQDAYIAIYRKCAQYRPDSNAMAWIYTVAKSAALNVLKKNARDLPCDFAEHDVYSSPLPTPEQAADKPITDLALKILDGDEYEILMLCDVSGYKRREVAEMLGIPLPTVTWKRARALKKLQNELKGADVYE